QFMRGFADEPRVESVDRRLVHRIEDFGQILAKLLLRYEASGMSRAILSRDLNRKRRLVLVPAAKFLESQGHRLDILLPGIAHQTNERAGVDSARQECTNRDIGDEMMAHAVQERFPDTEP